MGGEAWRILVIDDVASIHRDFKRILMPAEPDNGTTQLDELESRLFSKRVNRTPVFRFDVDFTLQGTEGLELVRAACESGRPYRAAFVDIRMPPGWDGVETISRIWELAPSTEIVVCTAYADYAWLDLVDRLGATDRFVILKKPFDPAEVQQLAFALCQKSVLKEQADDWTRQLSEANERLRLEAEQRAEVEAQVRQSERLAAVVQLAGGVAHDINNVLTVIRMGLDMVGREPQLSDRATRRLAEIEGACERVTTLVRSLLTFSRRQSVRLKPVNLAELVDGIGSVIERLIGDEYELRVDCDDGLRAVHADWNQMEQVVVNLAINARDAMPSGGTIAIEIRNATPPCEDVVLRVRDHGTGMPQEVLAQVFDPFFTTKEEGQGTGLGLSVVHGIVAGHNGTIEIQSEPGTGTVVDVRFPATAGDVAPPSCQEIEEQTTCEGDERILLVEDNSAAREMIQEILQLGGYRVTEAEDADSAIAELEHAVAPFDLVITDLRMPGMSGLDLAGRVVELAPDTRVLLISGDLGQCAAEGSAAQWPVLAKPFGSAQLLLTVRELFDRPHLRGTPEN